MIRDIQQSFAALYRDEEGASLIEYLLLVVLIGIFAITGMAFLGQTASNRMNNVGTIVADV